MDARGLARDVVGIFISSSEAPIARRLTGTGFIMRDGLIVTCWHCCSEPPPEGSRYVAAVTGRPDEQWREVPIAEISQDSNGKDLATGRVQIPAMSGLHLSSDEVEYGTQVWSFGYPLHSTYQGREGELRFELKPRYLSGYVTRVYYEDREGFGRTPSFELDMPCPSGLSGAPLFRSDNDAIIGVVYGTRDVATIEALASVDPETKERTPEIQRITSFGLAHFLSSLHELSGTATGGKRLLDIL